VRNANLRLPNPRNWRYNDPHLLDLAMVFLDSMGRRGYEFLRLTLGAGALPTPVTLRSHFRFRIPPITNLGFELPRLQQIPALYRSLGYNNAVFSISEDATSIRPTLSVRLADNILFGFAGRAPLCLCAVRWRHSRCHEQASWGGH